MRGLLAACAALITVLAVVSANLWFELRGERQVNADLRAQMLQMQNPVSRQALSPQPVDAANVLPAVAVPAPETEPVSAAVQTEPPPVVAQVQAFVIQAPEEITETRRTGALLQSEQTATARVLAWKDRLALAGHTLTTEQVQVLNAAAIAELRREAEDSLELEATSRPTDIETVVKMREETIDRQNETNMRILQTVSTHLTQPQAEALRKQFESGHAARVASFRAEREMLLRQVQ